MKPENKICEVDLNPELSNKINNPSNAVDIELNPDNWTEIDSEFDVPDIMMYYCVCNLNGILTSSFVNVIFDRDSKELALDYGVYENTVIDTDEIIFFSEEKPLDEIKVTVYYIR